MENEDARIQPEQLDSSWYSRFAEYGSFQAYEYLDGDKAYREDQKNKFLSGEIENPLLDYPKIDPVRLDTQEKELLLLKEDILAREQNPTVKQAYRWRLNEKIAEVRLLRAAHTGDIRRFKKYSEFVYGKPSADIFAYTVQSLRRVCEEASRSDDEHVRKTSEELTALLPENLTGDSVGELPDQGTRDMVRDETLKAAGDLISLPLGQEQFDAPAIKSVFDQALSTLKAKGWTVVIDTSSKSGISVDQENQTVKVPESRKLPFAELRTLVVHEIGTHVVRRINGERSKLKLLGLGLDRYERGDEGVATMREQSLEDKMDDFADLGKHLAISLAYGLDGINRDFRAVYGILEKQFLLEELLSGKDYQAALSTAQTLAWNRAVRTFRGTQC
ncbi:MAG: flavohemoglobin expression-modulating QEGLA motif protein, partial [Candidatus Roizmanbacteria bacterium]|nr:flavohemoglobin expression-modulating QEGLA motif protein [Candidatus Roizmanbacteria bacterium]